MDLLVAVFQQLIRCISCRLSLIHYLMRAIFITFCHLQGMVSGMWLLTVSLGSFIGASSGSAIYDVAGFSWSCTTEAILMGLSVSNSKLFLDFSMLSNL